MSEDRLPAAFDRTSLIGTEPYRAGSLGPRSPWSPERGDRRGFLPTPDPEAAGPGRQQRGWKVRDRRMMSSTFGKLCSVGTSFLRLETKFHSYILFQTQVIGFNIRCGVENSMDPISWTQEWKSSVL
jgi:hypothetical protein